MCREATVSMMSEHAIRALWVRPVEAGPLDPVGRRANVLVTGGGGRHDVGARLRLGEALIEIRGIATPCPVMDRAAPGMQAALRPEGRSGIWGRVLEGGLVRCGDPCTRAEDPQP